MKRRWIVVGNIGIGDAIWLLDLAKADGYENVAWCTRYTRPAVEVVDHFTNRRIDKIFVVETRGADVVVNTIQKYRVWADTFRPPAEPGDQICHLTDEATRGNFWCDPLTPAPRASSYLVAQTGSERTENSGWPPLLPALRALHQSYPVVTVSGPVVGQAMLGQDLMTVARLIRDARAVVAISSGVCVLSVLLGVPTVVASFVGDARAMGWPAKLPQHLRVLARPGSDDIISAVQAAVVR